MQATTTSHDSPQQPFSISQLQLFRSDITPQEQLALLKTYIEQFKMNKDKRQCANLFHYPPNKEERFREQFKKILNMPREALLQLFTIEMNDRKGIPAKINAQVKTLYDMDILKKRSEEHNRRNRLDDLPY